MNFMMQGLIAAAVLVTAHAHADVKYRVAPLKLPNGNDMLIRDFNNAGQILGWAHNKNYLSTPTGYELFTGGLPIQPFALNAQYLNEAGQVAFTYTNQAGTKPYLYSNGQRLDLTPQGPANPEGGATVIRGLNDRGQVVGVYEGKNFFFDGNESHYFDVGLPPNLTAFPNGVTNAGLIYGSVSGNHVGNQGFKYDGGNLTFLEEYEPFSMNNNNQMYAIRNNGTPLFVDSDGASRIMPMGFSDINDKGWVAGWNIDLATDTNHAYLWRDGHMTDINNLLVQDSRKWILTHVDEINDKGVIIGLAMLAGNPLGGGHQIIATPVPEAQSLVLMLCGMSAISFLVRRRQQCTA